MPTLDDLKAPQALLRRLYSAAQCTQHPRHERPIVASVALYEDAGIAVATDTYGLAVVGPPDAPGDLWTAFNEAVKATPVLVPAEWVAKAWSASKKATRPIKLDFDGGTASYETGDGAMLAAVLTEGEFPRTASLFPPIGDDGPETVERSHAVFNAANLAKLGAVCAPLVAAADRRSVLGYTAELHSWGAVASEPDKTNEPPHLWSCRGEFGTALILTMAIKTAKKGW